MAINDVWDSNASPKSRTVSARKEPTKRPCIKTWEHSQNGNSPTNSPEEAVFVCLLVFNIVAAIAAELPAQDPTTESIARRKFNQVFVKVIVPVTARTPKQDGPAVESWVAEQLKELGEPEYFAITDWVPVCDGLLADDAIDNRVWGGSLDGKHSYCPVGGDIPERKNGRLLVSVAGWTPGGSGANITLLDEPGSRAVGPMRLRAGQDGKRFKIEEGLPYVAVIIAPPPREAVKSHSDAE